MIQWNPKAALHENGVKAYQSVYNLFIKFAWILYFGVDLSKAINGLKSYDLDAYENLSL